jgi:transposase
VDRHHWRKRGDARLLVKRTLAPQGHTPILTVRTRHREKVSAIAAPTCSPVHKKLRLFFALHKNQAINHQRVAWFLRQLLRHLRGGKLLVIWDNGRMHRGPEIRRLLTRTRRLRLFALPPYAPECDPVEPLWRTLKTHRLAIYVPHTLEDLYAAAHMHLEEMAGNPALLAGFFNASKLRRPRRALAR